MIFPVISLLTGISDAESGSLKTVSSAAQSSQTVSIKLERRYLDSSQVLVRTLES